MIRAGPGNAGNAKRPLLLWAGKSITSSLALDKMTKITESKTLEFRFETFNTFNYTQFYPNGSIGGNINNRLFGTC
jgi:hypothetical protein